MSAIPHLSGLTKNGVSYGIRVGTGAPASGLGFPGEFYIDKDTTEFYGPKHAVSGWGDPFGGSGLAPGDLLAAILGIDGPGSNINADMVDGLHAADLQAWSNLIGKPSVFPPEEHGIEVVTGLQEELDDKLSKSFSNWSPITAAGTGAAQIITLPREDLSVNDVLVSITGVIQDPSAYSITGDSLTMTAPNSAAIVIRPYGYGSVSHKFASIQFVAESSEGDLITGVKGDLVIPFDCTIVEWTLLADAVGSIEIDLWKTDFANSPPTVSDSIVASAPPKLVNQSKNLSSVLTGWEVSVNSGDIIRVNTNTVSGIERITMSLKVML